MYEQYPNLLKPMKIGGVTVKNRFSVAPMGLLEILDDKGRTSDVGLEFFAERAKGGFGLITVPAIHPDTEIDPVVFPCVLDAEYVQRQKILLDRCHAYGAKMFIQVSFGLGRNGVPGCKSVSELPYYSAPDQKTPVLTTEEIRQKIDAVVKAAKFVQEIGFDGVEMHAMHWGYLLDQMSMSITNHRTDEFGGCLENRLRAAKELVQGIKAICGKDFPVCMRLSVKTFIENLFKPSLTGENEGGRTVEEAVEIAKLLEKYGYDILSVDAGMYDSFYYMLPPAYMEHGYLLPYIEQIKKNVTIPVVAAGARLNDPKIAEQAIAEKKIDGVVFGRQSLADPSYPNKIAMGRPEKIRTCISCNLGCNGESSMGKYTCCAINPAAIKEKVYSAEIALRPKKIAVIGAGVAGMQFALTAAERGHKVEVYEKEKIAGGLLLAAGHHDFKSEIAKLNLWFQDELKELGVPLHLGKEMSPEDIKSLDADTVVLTVGSDPIMPGLPGINHAKTVDCISAARDLCQIGDTVVVIGGGLTGCEIAYDLALKGKKVAVVDALDELMTSGTAFPNKLMMLDLFRHYGVEVVTGHRIEEINDDGAVISGKDGCRKTLPADNVIISIGFRAKPSMAGELYGCGKEIYSITTGIGSIMNSVRDAYEVARKI